MKPQDVIEHFGGQQKMVAQALGITIGAVSQWVTGGRVPMGRQWQIEAITRGKLRADRTT